MGVLVLALLWSVAWGQVHRVLHKGGATAQAVMTSAVAADQAAVGGLADEDGSNLCQLFDQLALGAGAATTQATLGQSRPPVPPAMSPAWPVWLAATRRFDARGPPTFA